MKQRAAGLLVTLTLTLASTGLFAQDPRMPQQEQLASIPRGLSGDLLLKVRRVGIRLRVPGKEETALMGQFVDGAGNQKPISIVHQISGMVRIDGVKDRQALTFDGQFSRGWSDRAEAGLLESFVSDTLEGLLYWVRKGGAVRLVGKGFGPDPRTVKEYNGLRYDIYEVWAPERTQPNSEVRLKRYFFDYATGLLTSTRYTELAGGGERRVETRFLEWRETDGSAYPGRVERYEDDRRVFTFVVEAAAGRTRQSVEAFR